MKKQYISELKPGDIVNSCFVVRKKELREFRDKPDQYISLEIGDKTGIADGVIWENTQWFTTLFNERDVIWIEGRVGQYRGKLQIVITALSRYQDYNPDDFILTTDKNIDKMLEYIKDAINKVEDTYLRALLDMFFTDMEFLAQFKRAPAARTIHHAYIGGLLEHTWELVQLWEVICRIYPQVNKDLLLTGAILHDIGKIKEFEYRTYIDYTEEGELIGHIVMSTDMILDKINAIEGFPDKLKLNIQHMILSHHGEYIWGSPKKPKTLEACILHHIDNLSAQSKRIIQSTGYCRGE